MPVSIDDLIKNISESGLLSVHEIDAFLDGLPSHDKPTNALTFAEVLTRYGKLTQMQATAAFQGKAQTLVLGDYVIMTQIGKGGMGQVFKARHRRMNRMVALKVLPPAATVSETAVRRFRREVEMAARLTHPNIVTAYDANECNGVHYLVMELVEGDNLSAAIKKDGVFPIDRAIDIIIQAAEGLAYAHEMGIVHRDIKPSNLLIDRHGTVKILDLGLARVDHNDEADADARDSLTQTNQVLGTVDFMSPEQSLNARVADHRADIYSLGCTFYRLLTGKNVYFGSTVIEKIVAHREKPIPSLRDMRPDVSPELNAAFQRMLCKDPAKRTQTMRQVIAELQECLSALTPNDPPPGTPAAEKKALNDSAGSQGSSQAGSSVPAASQGSATADSRDSVTMKDQAQGEGESTQKPEDPENKHEPEEVKVEEPTDQEDLSINPPSAASEPMAQPLPQKTRMGLVVGLASAVALIPLLLVVVAAPRPQQVFVNRAAVAFVAGDASRPVRPIALAGEDALRFADWAGSGLLPGAKDDAAAGLKNFVAGDIPAAIGANASGQTLILSVTAYGLAEQGVPFLLASDYRDPDGAAGRVALRAVLDDLKGLSTRWKLLILDAGPLPRDPRLGMLANEFPRRLAEEVAATEDPNLWVFAAYSPRETSHQASPGRQTLFSYFVTVGLRGQADLDGNRGVDLDELVRYVSTNVADFVAADTAGAETQTPVLLWGGGALERKVGEDGKPATDSPLDRVRQVLVAAGISPAEQPRPAAPIQKNALRLQGLVERAWMVRDSWDARAGWNFLEYAPHDWRAFQESLIDYEWLLRTAPELDDKALGVLADALEKDLNRLQELLEDRKSAPLAKEALAERLAAARPQVLVGVNDPSSIAMVPRMIWPEGDPDVREIEGLAKKLEEGLTKPKAAAGFPEFVNSAGVRYGQMVELRTASRLLKRTPKLAWQTVEQALQTRGLGEQVAAATLRFGAKGDPWCPPWVQARVAAADRALTEAERDLLYEPKIDERDFLAKVQEARQEYQSAWQDLSKIGPAMRLRNELLFRLPYYLRWHAASGLKCSDALRTAVGGPSTEDLRQLIAHLKTLSHVPSLPPADQLRVLDEEARTLAAIRARIERGLEERHIAPLAASPYAPGHLWRIHQLLSTPLLSAPNRAKLTAAVAGATPVDSWFRARKTDLPPLDAVLSLTANPTGKADATPVNDWQPLLDQADLETLTVDLADSFVAASSATGSASVAPAPSAVAESFQQLKAAHERFAAAPEKTSKAEGELWVAYRKLGADLKIWYADLPAELVKEYAELDRLDLTRSADRAKRAAGLDSVDFQLRFVDARDARRVTRVFAPEAIRKTQLQGLLLWQEERFQAASQESRQADLKYLRDMARVSRRQAEAIQPVPARE